MGIAGEAEYTYPSGVPNVTSDFFVGVHISSALVICMTSCFPNLQFFYSVRFIVFVYL